MQDDARQMMTTRESAPDGTVQFMRPPGEWMPIRSGGAGQAPLQTGQAQPLFAPRILGDVQFVVDDHKRKPNGRPVQNACEKDQNGAEQSRLALLHSSPS